MTDGPERFKVYHNGNLVWSGNSALEAFAQMYSNGGILGGCRVLEDDVPSYGAPECYGIAPDQLAARVEELRGGDS